MKNPKNVFLNICIVFSIFNVISEEFKFNLIRKIGDCEINALNIDSIFNALISQSLIFLIESMLILLAFKKYKKKEKIKIEKKKSWGTSLKT